MGNKLFSIKNPMSNIRKHFIMLTLIFMISIVPILGNKKPNINMCDPPKLHKIKGGYDAEPRNYYSIYLIH